MRNIKNTLIALSLLLLYSCSNQPKCDGGDVEEVVFDFFEDVIKKEIKKNYFNANYNYSDVYRYANDNDLDFNQVNEETKKKIENDASVYARVEIIKITFELNGARLVSVNEKLKMCECAAELIINSKDDLDIVDALDIEYTAQYTEDGQVYVDISY